MSIDWIPTGSARKITAKEIGNRGFFPSNKVKGGITEYESCLERDFLLVCNHAPSVKRFQHQPLTINYMDKKGKNRKYTPDVYVEYTNGMKGLYEIKYEEEVINKGKNYEERWSEAKKWASERGMVFSVFTEKQIRNPRWFNIWFTLGSSKCYSNNEITSKLNALIPNEGETYNQLCFILSEELGIEINKAAQILCYAIYHGLVFVDSFSIKQLSKDTIIRKRKQKNKTPFKPLYEEIGISITSNIKEIKNISETLRGRKTKEFPSGFKTLLSQSINNYVLNENEKSIKSLVNELHKKVDEFGLSTKDVSYSTIRRYILKKKKEIDNL